MARRYPARLARAVLVDGVLRPAVRALAPPRMHGLDRLDALDEPVIFAANHHSHLDTSVLLGAIPSPFRHRTVVAAAADYFFSNRIGGTAAALVLNAIPIERTKVNRRSAELATELLEDGWSILIFPEGGRSPDGWGQEFRGGAAYLSVKVGVPVVPIHLAGTDRILAKGMKRPQPGPVTVRFGNPMRPDEGEDARVVELLDGRSDDQVVRPEAVAPLADAVRLVDDEQLRARTVEGIDDVRIAELLGCEQQEFEITALERFHCRLALSLGDSRAQIGRDYIGPFGQQRQHIIPGRCDRENPHTAPLNRCAKAVDFGIAQIDDVLVSDDP